MKPRAIRKFLTLALAALFTLAVGCIGVGPEPPDARESGAPPFSEANAVDLPKGTPIYVRLRQSISSSTAEAGQHFSALLDEPLMVNGRLVAPRGSALSGFVVAARRSGRPPDAGYLRLTLSSLTINGKDIPIETSSVFVEGGSYKNRNLAFTSGGSGSDQGNLIGSIIGDGSGTTAAFVTDKKEVGFSAEHRMGFRLIQPLKIG
jgi:hypothetical protein